MEYIATDGCRRKEIIRHFPRNTQICRQEVSGCDIWAETCNCGIDCSKSVQYNLVSDPLLVDEVEIETSHCEIEMKLK